MSNRAPHSDVRGKQTKRQTHELDHTSGQTVYVRLWTNIGGIWQWNDYTYIAGGGAVADLRRQDPFGDL